MADQFVGRTTAIPGLIIFEVASFGDERGYFQEKYQHDKLVAAGLPAAFTVKQYNVAYSKQVGVTRGAHAQTGGKYIGVTSGKVFAAFIDLRKGDTFGAVVTAEIGPNQTAYAPMGIANSYQVLEPETYYLYSCDEVYDESQSATYRFVNVGDAALDIDWPIPLDKAIISEKDRALPLLANVIPMEV